MSCMLDERISTKLDLFRRTGFDFSQRQLNNNINDIKCFKVILVKRVIIIPFLSNSFKISSNGFSLNGFSKTLRSILASVLSPFSAPSMAT